MPTITGLKARQVFDSRGVPTVEAEIFLSNNGFGRFITPSGASCGSREALELRDHDLRFFMGKGVLKALSNINEIIAPAILQREFKLQSDLDSLLIELDGTKNKSRLGANAILPVSAAFFIASANGQGLPIYEFFGHRQEVLMPMPMINILNGGAHANNGLEVQEFMLVPKGASTFHQSLQWSASIFHNLKDILQDQGHSTAVGDEGGFAPKLKNNEEALDLLCQAVEKSKLNLGTDIGFALDVAASEFYDEEEKTYKFDQKNLNSAELLLWYEKIIKKYPIISIEDPYFEQDFLGFAAINKKLGQELQIVGDDLFVTDQELIKAGAKNKLANAVLIKINQIGSITQTLQAIEVSKYLGLNTIISHRSGESEDTTIADLCVLTEAGQIKTGSLSRSERVAKYNRLLRIEEELGPRAIFKSNLRFR